MQVRANQLDRHLAGGDFPVVYLVTGDEQLLVEEACDAIMAAAKASGFDERTLFEAAPRAPWHDLFADAANLSLFASKRLLDVRIAARGLDRAGSDAIRRYLDKPLTDTLLICRAVGLEWRQRSAAWYKAIDKAGVVVPIWPISARELPRWLDGRCRTAGLMLDQDALAALADRVEGNLLAARQEIDKLKLLGRQGAIRAEDVENDIGDSSRFDTFQLIDAAFAGNGARARKMLGALRQEGVAVFMIMGALVNQLRRARQLADGGNPRLPRNRQQLVAAAVRRLGTSRIDELIADCALLDLQAKGMLRGDAWQSLERILLTVAGVVEPALARDLAGEPVAGQPSPVRPVPDEDA